jgi:hypothetical protein
MTTGTIPLFDRDGRERIFSLEAHARMVGNGEVGPGRSWSSVPPPPQGWELEVPKYKVTREVVPSPRPRHRTEPPFAYDFQTDVWQYAARVYKAGEIVETKDWPHSSFLGITYGAKMILEFFKSRPRSSLTTTPWDLNQIRLVGGMAPMWLRPEDLPRPKPPRVDMSGLSR